MDFSGLLLVKITGTTKIKPFDCGNPDLNDFLQTKAIVYSNELLATTYLLESETETVAYFSIFNDNIRAQEIDFASKSALKRFLAEIVPYGKRHLEYFPAIKIGRLGVRNSTQRQGTGKAIISFVVDLALTQNQNCACKFISVDAKSGSVGFYKRLKFNFLTDNDKLEETRQMYLDLTPIINTASSSSQDQ